MLLRWLIGLERHQIVLVITILPLLHSVRDEGERGSALPFYHSPHPLPTVQHHCCCCCCCKRLLFSAPPRRSPPHTVRVSGSTGAQQQRKSVSSLAPTGDVGLSCSGPQQAFAAALTSPHARRQPTLTFLATCIIRSLRLPSHATTALLTSLLCRVAFSLCSRSPSSRLPLSLTMSLAGRLRPASMAHRLRSLSFVSALPSSSCSPLSLSSSVSAPSFACSVRWFASERGGGGAINEEGEAIGLTGRQYEVALLGNFPDTPTVQPFGTMKRPAFIYSGLTSRIVGCVGGGNYAHRLQWFQLKEGKKHVCSHCGQVFKLVTDRNYEEVKDLVDDRTREHYDYYQTLDIKGRDEPPAIAEIEVGPNSKY